MYNTDCVCCLSFFVKAIPLRSFHTSICPMLSSIYFPLFTPPAGWGAFSWQTLRYGYYCTAIPKKWKECAPFPITNRRKLVIIPSPRKSLLRVAYILHSASAERLDLRSVWCHTLCACMCACVSVCACVCVSVSVCVPVPVSVTVSVCMPLSVCVYLYVAVCACTCVCVCVCQSVRACLCLCLYLCVCQHVHVCICVCICMCLCLYLCLCICVYLRLYLYVPVTVCVSVCACLCALISERGKRQCFSEAAP